MPTVEKTSGGEVYLTAIGERVATGGRVDVPAGLAEHLTEKRGDFKVVDDSDESADADEVDSDDVDEEDTFDLEEFLEQNVPPAVEAIKAGDVDENLDAIAKAADRTGIQDAINERRAELEG